jgi:aspartyl-tRNA synthetase
MSLYRSSQSFSIASKRLRIRSYSSAIFPTVFQRHSFNQEPGQYLAVQSRHFLATSSATSSSNSLSAPRIDYYAYKTDSDDLEFGDYNSLASQEEGVTRPYVSVDQLDESYIDKKVWIRGRVSNVRAKGNACFLIIRGGSFFTVQSCHFKDKAHAELSKKFIKFVGDIPLESIVDVYGEVVAADVKSCTQQKVEIQALKVITVSRAPVALPFLLEDAARSQAEISASENSDRPLSGVTQEIRLNNRWLDLRVPANNAVMRLRSAVSLLFREALLNERFIEINSPKLIAGASEGGSEVFRTDYFGTPACLAQSPQLYKQMAISADLDRVFEIGPVFRAEKSHTKRHLCEFTGLDLEMAIDSHYSETLGVLHRLFRHIFEGLEARFAKELSVVREQYPSEPVRFTAEPLIIHWWDAIAMLREAGHQAEDFEDLSTPQELILGDLVKQKFNADFYIVDQYPSKIRPFYTMPNPQRPQYSNSYDLFLRGQEICSGAQRCHDTAMLEERIVKQGIDLQQLKDYVDSFRHGVSPHAGAGIGLDRVVFLYLALDNVRKASMFPRDPTRITP